MHHINPFHYFYDYILRIDALKCLTHELFRAIYKNSNYTKIPNRKLIRHIRRVVYEYWGHLESKCFMLHPKPLENLIKRKKIKRSVSRKRKPNVSSANAADLPNVSS